MSTTAAARSPSCGSPTARASYAWKTCAPATARCCKVWLSDAPVIEGTAGWRVFDDNRHVDLGDLKGNIGSSNYPIPPDVDLAALSGVSIWCARFHVSFAAATLRPVATP